MHSSICLYFRWIWLVAVAITATVIAFRRFASNERVAYAVAVGAARRRGEPSTPQAPISESSLT